MGSWRKVWFQYRKIAQIIEIAWHRGNVPPTWLEVLTGEMLASQTAHIRHSGGGFMFLIKQAYVYLPIQYMRPLHCIIWEQTKMYLAGGLRGLNGLSHPQAPQNTEQVDDEFFKRSEDRWKIGEYQQSQTEKDSIKDWLYLVDNDPLEMTRELNRLTGKDIGLIICGEERLSLIHI